MSVVDAGVDYANPHAAPRVALFMGGEAPIKLTEVT